MKDVEGILPKIEAGIYKLVTRRTGKSEVWNVFGEIAKRDGSIVHGYLCCRKCYSLHKFDGKRTSNLNRHKCFKMLTKNEDKVRRFFEMMDSSSDNGPCERSNNFDDKKLKEIVVLDDENKEGGNDTDGGDDTEYDDDMNKDKEDDMEDAMEDIDEDVKLCNPLDLISSPNESEHYEPSQYKRKKTSPDYITPTRKQRNLKQLDGLCAMIKSDLHDAPDDLFFVAKWKIMDILRDVQSKRLERRNPGKDNSRLLESKDV